MLSIIISFLLSLQPQYLESYNASLIDKMERLENIENPKIVLIGDSNLAFGINSEDIEEAFGMPVVNMGLHAGLGSMFSERMAKINVNEGDIYIISRNSFGDDGILQPTQAELIWITIEDHFKLWKLLRIEDFPTMLEAYPVYIKKCILLWLNKSGNQSSGDVYSRDAFNLYGDIEWEDQGLEYEFQEGTIGVPTVSDIVSNRLNELNKYLADRGATLLIAGCPIPDNEYTPDRELFFQFQKDLECKINAKVISDVKDYFYPDSYFFNSELHLNNEGKRIRTQQLIDDLKRYLETGYVTRIPE